MTYAPDQPPGDAAPEEETGSRRGLGCLLEIVETLVLTLVIYLLIHNFVAQPFEVEQTSMEPTIDSHEYVLIDKITPHFDTSTAGTSSSSSRPRATSRAACPSSSASSASRETRSRCATAASTSSRRAARL